MTRDDRLDVTDLGVGVDAMHDLHVRVHLRRDVGDRETARARVVDDAAEEERLVDLDELHVGVQRDVAFNASARSRRLQRRSFEFESEVMRVRERDRLLQRLLVRLQHPARIETEDAGFGHHVRPRRVRCEQRDEVERTRHPTRRAGPRGGARFRVVPDRCAGGDGSERRHGCRYRARAAAACQAERGRDKRAHHFEPVAASWSAFACCAGVSSFFTSIISVICSRLMSRSRASTPSSCASARA